MNKMYVKLSKLARSLSFNSTVYVITSRFKVLYLTAIFVFTLLILIFL